jgi:hypothetical protein
MRTYNKIALALIFISLNVTTYAQKPVVGCVDVNVQGQAEGLKAGLAKQGMGVFQEAMFQMASMEPVPVAVKMNQGVSYQLIFVGSENANKMIMEIYDGKDKKVDEKVERGASNSIVYSFTPKKTDVYLITLIQKKGLKNLCGYFGVMMKGLPAIANTQSRNNEVTPVKAAPVTKAVKPAKTTTTIVKTTTVKKAPAVPAKTAVNTPAPATPAATNKSNTIPDNQRPNPNRTRATNEALKQQGKL